ncbi:MAG: rod shape-determining protein RodA [Chloroflexi bacterium]|nr:rod shape-determining protein RodA [Chloroflexota bacterium]
MERKIWRNFDFVLLAATVLLIAFGIAMIHSATPDTPDLQDLPRRQVIWALVGLAWLPLVAAIDYRFFGSLQKPLYALTVASLLLVLLVGQTTYGAQRWISGASFQPSELAKVLIVVTLAQFLAQHEKEIGRFHYVLFSIIHVAVPMALIYVQPHLGTVIVLAVVWLIMVLMAGMRVLHLGILGFVGVLTTPLIWFSLKDYMQNRLLLFINPAQNPAARYNIDQALISIGSGGWLGKGYASGSQSQLHFLRVRHTDFIFSVIGEEMGFVGALLLFALLGIVLWRILRAASLSRDSFGRLMACGVAALIFFQSIVNIGMNLGLLPVIGIPLPFISAGGSSLITLLIAEGLVQSVVMRHRKIEFREREEYRLR